MKEFEEALSTFDISGMAEEMGVPKDMVDVSGGVLGIVLWAALGQNLTAVVLVVFCDCVFFAASLSWRYWKAGSIMLWAPLMLAVRALTQDENSTP